MHSDKANIKIKLDDSVLKKINAVDDAVASVEAVHREVNEINDELHEDLRKTS